MRINSKHRRIETYNNKGCGHSTCCSKKGNSNGKSVTHTTPKNCPTKQKEIQNKNKVHKNRMQNMLNDQDEITRSKLK